MTEVLTAAQMRALEVAAMDGGAVTGLELMERAGQGAVQAVLDHWPVLATGPRTAVVLCGPGNNGGDGFVMARHLLKMGWQVRVFFAGKVKSLPADAAVNYRAWAQLGAVEVLDDTLDLGALNARLIIDAVFGIGLSRPVVTLGPVFQQISKIADARTGTDRDDHAAEDLYVVAVDIPSGICADSGRVLGDEADNRQSGRASCHVIADLTVTFHLPKLGHVLADGIEACGDLICVDIGLPCEPAKPDTVRLVNSAPSLSKRSGHKYDHGHVLAMAGGVGKGGAARLAARAALRIGAGAVTLGAPPAALIENAAQLNAIMLDRVGSADDLKERMESRRVNALCIGPGLGTTRHQADILAGALEASVPCVVDADALTLMSYDADLFAKLHHACVLTPHWGEFQRLFPDIAARLNADVTTGPAYSKVDAARDAAMRGGCTVLFKGPDTIIASPQGTSAVHLSARERAVPWLATAGAGDVLAGFIAGLLARGFGPQVAAETATWLHTACAQRFGPGLIAEDLSEELPKVLRDIDAVGT